ncbi:membrane transporter [Coprinopsis sp. MPI-PUGE-AT-0042]|nr:membrane transporter [Coprinopsis sp. MPI-PUGE-AT-0042]
MEMDQLRMMRPAAPEPYLESDPESYRRSHSPSEPEPVADVEQQQVEEKKSYWGRTGVFLVAMDGTVEFRPMLAIGSELKELKNTSWIANFIPLAVTCFQRVLNMIFAVGTAAGASLGGYFADTIGWRWSFLLQIPIAVCSRGNLHEKIKRVDFAGAITLLLTVSLLLVGLDRGGDLGWHDNIARYSMIGFAVFGALLVFIEFEWAQHPFAPKRVIINRSMIASYLVNLFGIGAQFQVLFHVPLYLQAASLPLIFGVVCSMAGSVSSGLIMQSTGKYYWLSVVNYGLVLVGVVCITLNCGIIMSSMVMITVGLMFSSFGTGTGLTTSLISLIANAGPQDQAVATAVSYLFRSMGSVVGLSAASMITQMALKSALRERLAGGQDVDEIVRRVRESLDYLNELDEVTRGIVRGSYETAIQTALYFAITVGTLALVSSFFIKEAPLPSKK